jgi:hypothetical protein
MLADAVLTAEQVALGRRRDSSKLIEEGATTVRVLLRFTFPTETGNALIKSGKMGEVLQSVLSELKPEAAYFTVMGGDRGGFIVFDLTEPDQMPAVVEPFFLALGAKVELSPVMTAEDVPKRTANLGEVIQKYTVYSGSRYHATAHVVAGRAGRRATDERQAPGVVRERRVGRDGWAVHHPLDAGGD